MNNDPFNLQLDAWSEETRKANLTDMEVLSELVVQNAELEKLEEKLQQFNIFEAIGMQWQEIRHSAFLAFLLDPKQPHGLGEDFLKKVLQRALLCKSAVPLAVNVVSLHLMDLEDTVVEREQSNIDVLLLSERHKLAIIIENKLQSGEHDNQLGRYYEHVQRQHPGWRVLALYLTIEGALPSDNRYLPVSYADVADIVGALVVSRETVLGPDVRTLMLHYVQMLRRNIVSDAELDELCRMIYHKHKRAIDLIVARIPDKQAIIQQALIKMIEETPGIRLRWHGKSAISFHPEEWDVPALQYASGKDEPALIFQFYLYNSTQSLDLWLEIRTATEETQQRLFDMAGEHGFPFNAQQRKIGGKWRKIYTKSIISRKQMPQLQPTDIIAEAYKKFRLFIDNDLPVIKKALEAQSWVWNTQTTDASQSGVTEELEEEEDE